MNETEVLEYIEQFGQGFHPDTKSDEYSQMLTDKEQVQYNRVIDSLYKLYPDNIYVYGSKLNWF